MKTSFTSFMNLFYSRTAARDATPSHYGLWTLIHCIHNLTLRLRKKQFDLVLADLVCFSSA